MGSVRLNLLLVLVLAGMIGVQWLLLPDPSRRNWEFLPDMVESPARGAQAPVPTLADGTVVDLRPPAGSVARGFIPLQYPATPEGALLAGRELVNHIPVDDSDEVARGAFVYATFCTVCHGAGGHGDGTATKLGVPPPPSLLADHAMEMSDGQMYHVVSLGQANMASYASQVTRDDRWRVINYIRALQRSPEAPPTLEAAEALREEPSEVAAEPNPEGT